MKFSNIIYFNRKIITIIKFHDQSERKLKVRMGSWLLQI